MGSHSSGLSNMLFMNKGASIIDIRDPNDNIKNAFFTLSSELDLKYYYMEREDINSNIVINPNKLENLLKSLFNFLIPLFIQLSLESNNLSISRKHLL